MMKIITTNNRQNFFVLENWWDEQVAEVCHSGDGNSLQSSRNTEAEFT